KLLSARFRDRSNEVPTFKVETSRMMIAPRVLLVESREFNLESVRSTSMRDSFRAKKNDYKERVKSRILALAKWIVRVNYYILTSQHSAEVEFRGEKPSEKDLLEVLVYIHSTLGHIESGAALFERRLLDRCRRTVTNVIDISTAPKGPVKFRLKADGETAWIVDGGSI
ncbi:hypothetical protein HAX54_013914, partial [Datura stramonium]|nr:hypothetical protein [Datura stramonium]